MKGNVTALVTTNQLHENTLVSISLSDFLAMKIEPQEAILEPWLNSKSLNMLHAKRGVGKTYMGLSIAHAVATGTNCLKWKAPKPRKVVYFDGEMSSYTLQSRLSAISEANLCEPMLLNNLSIFTPDLQKGPIPDLADRNWHDSVRGLIADAELVIVDNLSCLARSGGPENDADSWNVLADWALKLRREGIAVLFMHHSGKSGQQRGTSRKEDILNVVINLKHPVDYSPEMGALFEVHFEKGRELFGEDSKAFIAKLISEENSHLWEVTDIEDSNFDRVIAMSKLGLNLGEIAAELCLSKSSISRYLKRAREEGLIKKTE
jgi:hypothetical protein